MAAAEPGAPNDTNDPFVFESVPGRYYNSKVKGAYTTTELGRQVSMFELEEIKFNTINNKGEHAYGHVIYNKYIDLLKQFEYIKKELKDFGSSLSIQVHSTFLEYKWKPNEIVYIYMFDGSDKVVPSYLLRYNISIMILQPSWDNSKVLYITLNKPSTASSVQVSNFLGGVDWWWRAIGFNTLKNAANQKSKNLGKVLNTAMSHYKYGGRRSKRTRRKQK